MKSKLLLTISLLGITSLTAQTANITPKNAVPMPHATQVSLSIECPEKIIIGPKENFKQMTVKLVNTSDTSVEIMGVQVSGAVYIVKYPTTVAKSEELTLAFLRDRNQNFGTNMAMVSFLTKDKDGKISQIQTRFSYDMQSPLDFGTSQPVAIWEVNAELTPKVIKFILREGMDQPKLGVSPTNFTVELTNADSEFTVTVTPKTTNKQGFERIELLTGDLTPAVVFAGVREKPQPVAPVKK